MTVSCCGSRCVWRQQLGDHDLGSKLPSELLGPRRLSILVESFSWRPLWRRWFMGDLRPPHRSLSQGLTCLSIRGRSRMCLELPPSKIGQPIFLASKWARSWLVDAAVGTALMWFLLRQSVCLATAVGRPRPWQQAAERVAGPRGGSPSW